MTIITKGMGIIIKKLGKRKISPVLKDAQKQFKKLLDKKKGKDLDWGDVKKSFKIFTKK